MSRVEGQHWAGHSVDAHLHGNGCKPRGCQRKWGYRSSRSENTGKSMPCKILKSVDICEHLRWLLIAPTIIIFFLFSSVSFSSPPPLLSFILLQFPSSSFFYNSTSFPTGVTINLPIALAHSKSSYFSILFSTANLAKGTASIIKWRTTGFIVENKMDGFWVVARAV